MDNKHYLRNISLAGTWTTALDDGNMRVEAGWFNNLAPFLKTLDGAIQFTPF